MNKFKWSAPPQVGMEVQLPDGSIEKIRQDIGCKYGYLINKTWHDSSCFTPANWHFKNDGSARAMRCVKAIDKCYAGNLKGMVGNCYYQNESEYTPPNSYLCDLSQAEALLGLDEWEAEITRRFKVGDEVEWCIHGTWSKEFKIHTVESDHYIVSQKISNRASYWRADESDIRPAPKQPTMEEDITLLLKDKSFHVLETCKLIANDIMQIIKRHESK